MEQQDYNFLNKKDSYEIFSSETIASYSSYNENSHLIEKKIDNQEYLNINSVFNKISSSLIAMLQGVEVLCNFSIMFLFKDNYKLDPASLNIVMSLIKIPWSIKLLWAILSDSYPIFGYRRKYYLLLGSLSCIISLVSLGLINHTNIGLTIGLLIIFFFGSSLCNVIGEAQVVESSRKGSFNNSAKNVSAFFAFRKFSFAAMSYLSGYLLSFMIKQHIFIIGSFLPICVFVSSFFIIEKKNCKKTCMKEQVKCIYDILKIPHIKNIIIFIFIMMSTPSCGNTLFFFMTNELKFGVQLLGKMDMFRSIASLISILSYMFFFSKMDIGKLLFYSTIIITPFCLLPLIVVNKLNNFFYIPNSVFIITDTILIEFIGEFQTMPLLVLCSRIIPEGLESTIYSLLLSANNLALIISSFFSSVLTYILGITSTNFKNLSLMIIICSLTNLIPLFFMYIVPTFNNRDLHKYNYPCEKIDYETTDFASSSSEKNGKNNLSEKIHINGISLE
ncbi:folate transporter 1, putative [Plasmodium relictum]|uniref:Folate transporter 1, putative n=1 Tax=Plasmodium relictum TaxID=85471 RepID=A0A1J1HEB2_PLARL|nr:folate transporter 1, putative [Plasmodium relictum]CRH03751.1 folate transporter 1, putative [Plasmodium relictum]